MTAEQRECLTAEQVRFYNETGYLVLENHLDMAIIQDIRDEIARLEASAFGMTESDDRLDLEDSHTPDSPRVRRIKLPHTQSDVIRKLLYSDRILAPIRDLIGPNLRLHTTKLNMKSAEYPGSHKGPIHDHHRDGVFAGGMSLSAAGLAPEDAVELTGPAGSISIHHGRIVHGSARNTSDRSRRLMFFEMMASDAFPITGGMTKFTSIKEYDELILCGEPVLEPRLADVPVRIPQPQPDKNKSIYEIQKGMNPSDLIR